MADTGTHSSEAMYGLGRALGRGPRLWAGYVDVADDETIDTGLDTIEGLGGIAVEDTDIDALSQLLYVKSITGGTITFQSAAVGAYGDSTATFAYLLVAGAIR